MLFCSVLFFNFLLGSFSPSFSVLFCSLTICWVVFAYFFKVILQEHYQSVKWFMLVLILVQTVCKDYLQCPIYVCFWSFYVPVNNFSIMLRWIFQGWTRTKQRIPCHAELKGHNPVPQVRLKPTISRSWVKNSITDLLHISYSVWSGSAPYAFMSHIKGAMLIWVN